LIKIKNISLGSEHGLVRNFVGTCQELLRNFFGASQELLRNFSENS
jgi:hypothetical protein